MFALNALLNFKKWWGGLQLVHQQNSNLVPSCKERPAVPSESENRSPVWTRMLNGQRLEIVESRFIKAFEQKKKKDRNLEQLSSFLKAFDVKVTRAGWKYLSPRLGQSTLGTELPGSPLTDNVASDKCVCYMKWDNNGNSLIRLLRM